MDRTAVLVAEYADLRAEMARRSTAQLVILVVSFALVLAAVPIQRLLVGDDSVVALALPYLFTVTAWLHVSQDHTIVNIATYLQRQLRPAIVETLGAGGHGGEPADGLLGWGAHLGEQRRRETPGPFLVFTWGMRTLATLGPSLGLTVWALAGLGWSELGGLQRAVAIALAVGNALLVLGVAVMTRSVPRGYRSITQPAADD